MRVEVDGEEFKRPLPHLMGAEELIARFGISRVTLWRYRRAGKLPKAIRVGHGIFFDEEEVASTLAKWAK